MARFLRRLSGRCREGAISRILGIDVGGTKVALAVGDEQGHVLARSRRSTEASGDPARDLERLVADARGLLAESGVSASQLTAVGLSFPGPLDPETGVVHTPPNLPGWHHVQVRDPLADAFGCPVILENDANAAALAEWRFGAGRGYQDVVYLTMSTGVGAGLVLGGRLHRGVHCSAGEFGHAPVEWDGEPCVCGMRGCLEAYVGGAAWMRRLRQRTPPESEAARLAGSVEAVRPEHLVQAAKRGDPFSRGEMSRWVDYLGRGIVQIVFGIAPEVIVLGTIAVSAGEELCFAPLREIVDARVWVHLTERLAIVPAQLGKELPYQAGLAVALQAG